MKILCVTKCPTGMVQTYVAAEKLEQAGKKLGIDLSVETQGAMGIQNQFSPEQIDEADYILIAADVAIDEASRFGNKKLYVTSLEDAIVHPEQILESLTTKSYSYQDATVSNKKILGWKKAITFMILMVTNVVVFSNICDDQIKIQFVNYVYLC